MKGFIKLLVSLIVCQLAGVIGSIFTASSVKTWYPAINKPSFTPPNWLFGPVWLTLYTLMGISLYLVWQRKNNKGAIKIFIIQLIFNSLWSIIFFGLRQTFWAFLVIIILWFLILLSLFVFLSYVDLLYYQ